MARIRGRLIIKKYGNRRLYDTENSHYLTQDELAAKIQAGDDVRILDAKTGEDLTQATLTQIIVEGRQASRLLPVPLLTQLIRLNDEALGEFLGRYVAGALELYLQARRGAEAMGSLNPFATLPFSATSAMASLFHREDGGTSGPSAPPADDVESLRREIDELKDLVRAQSGAGSTTQSEVGTRGQAKRKRKSRAATAKKSKQKAPKKRARR